MPRRNTSQEYFYAPNRQKFALVDCHCDDHFSLDAVPFYEALSSLDTTTVTIDRISVNVITFKEKKMNEEKWTNTNTHTHIQKEFSMSSNAVHTVRSKEKKCNAMKYQTA